MRTTTKLALGLGVAVAATPLGILARGSAWGEWASEALAHRLGFVPQGLRRLEALWSARLSGYAVPGHSGAASYLASAVIGVAVIGAAAWLLGLMATRLPPRAFRKSVFERTLDGVEHFLTVFILLEEMPQKRGLLQKVDPRVKLVTLLACVVLTTFSSSLRALAIFYAATLLLAAASRLPLGSFLLRTWFFVPLFTAAMVFPVLFHGVLPGQVVWRSGPLAITQQGVHLAALLVLRAATAISWSLLLVLTTRWTKLLGALRVLGVPQPFVWTLLMMVRYLEIFVRQLQEFQWAVKSRMLSPMSARQGRRVVTHHMGALFQRSLASAEDVYAAMVSRGYTGEATARSWWALGRRDYYWLFGWLAGVVLWLRFR